MNTLLQDQNNPSFIRLLKAQWIAYNNAKKYQIIDVISFLIALSPTVLFFIDFSDSNEDISKLTKVTSILAIAGVVWSLISIFSQSFIDKQTQIGATIQDQFDTQLFKLETNSILIGNWIETSQIVQLSKKYSKEDLKNWYSINIPDDIDNYASVLLAYKCNTIYSKSQRRKYVNFLKIILVIYYGGLISVSLYNDIKVFDLFLLLAPSISALVYIAQTIYSQNGIILTYEKINILVEEKYRSFKATQVIPTGTELRQIQDLFYTQRLISNKVPTWFYKIFKEKTEEVVNESIEIMTKE